MTQTDRTEVREMIQGILSGWHAATTAQNDMTNQSLERIEKHLVKLNGSVAEHERVILENLPHSIDHCPQAPVIKEIRDAVIKDEGGRLFREVTFGRSVAVIGTIVAIIMVWQGYKSLLKEAKDTKSEVKITNDVLHSPAIRGIPYNPFAKDSINGTNTH